MGDKGTDTRATTQLGGRTTGRGPGKSAVGAAAHQPRGIRCLRKPMWAGSQPIDGRTSGANVGGRLARGQSTIAMVGALWLSSHAGGDAGGDAGGEAGGGA